MTTAFDLLQQLRSDWIKTVHDVWEHDPPGFQISDSLLRRFFEALADSLLTNQWHAVEALIETWCDTRPAPIESPPDFGTYTEKSLLGLLHTFQGALLSASRAKHKPIETLQLIEAVAPIIFHMVEFAGYREAQVQLELVAAKQQEAHQAIEILNESRARFIGLATQNLRTPLTLIEGYLSLLRERMNDGYVSDVWLDGISAGSKKMRTLIDELIDVARVDNKMLSLRYRRAKMSDVLERIRQTLKSEIKSRSLSIRIQRCKEFRQPIYIDPERVEQAVRYVVENAIRVSPKGTDIQIRGRELYGFLEVTIQDGGPGIAAKDQNRIFEPVRAVRGGEGESPPALQPYLGLHLAKGILESHEGAIWVSSKGYDERNLPGSTFHIMIPHRHEPPDDLTSRLLGTQRFDADE